MKSEVEGIPQVRLNRLWRHLLKLEELTGMSLRKEPRDEECPIGKFAPGHNKQGAIFNTTGKLFVWYEQGNKLFNYSIYGGTDITWWQSLTEDECTKVTKWIQNKIAERSKK